MANKSNLTSSRKISERIWEELKKINWREVNRVASQPFTIGLVGSESAISEMKNWLSSFPYNLSSDANNNSNSKAVTMNEHAMDKIVVFSRSEQIDERLIKSMSFCIAEKSAINEVRRSNVQSYIFDSKENQSLISDILSNNDDIRFALSFNFPVFRPDCARGEINATALQNATWAVGTAAPNLIPGPQQVVTAPIEAISDFAVLTTNEVKMMFELLGISGYKVNPLKALVEFSVLVSVAKLAQMTATQLSGKIPAGVGLVAKGAIAYAFTFAIGEALLFYISTGQKVGKEFFDKNVPVYFEKGKEVIGVIIEKMKSKK
jgi:uncharacterized protein (DUF697 family)